MKHADGAVYEGKMIIVIRAIRQYTDFGMVKNVQYVGTCYSYTSSNICKLNVIEPNRSRSQWFVISLKNQESAFIAYIDN